MLVLVLGGVEYEYEHEYEYEYEYEHGCDDAHADDFRSLLIPSSSACTPSGPGIYSDR